MTDQKNKQSSSDKGMKPGGGDQGSKHIPHDDTDEAVVRKGADIENPDQQPEKRVELDDNPDETRKKIPNL